ncbi:MAG TPA: hypothetical protein PK843_10305 [bacterium]|nr:hypothetical protein [bacterium]
MATCSTALFAQESAPVNPEHPGRLPDTFLGRRIAPQIGCWFPRADDVLEPGGFKSPLDALGRSGAFDLLCVSSRSTQNESDSDSSVKFLNQAADYARKKYGVRLVLDAEIRLSRKSFFKAHPECSQERLQLVERLQSHGQKLEIRLKADALSDHYTHNYRYEVLGCRLIKVWSYQRAAADTVDAASVRDITAEVERFTADSGRCVIVLSGEKAQQDRFVCAAAAFAFLYPDVHSDEALHFERDLIAKHRQINAAGFIKDEWGFPPSYTWAAEKNEYWFSPAMVQRYAKISGGRDLADDCFLMYHGQTGRARERRQAIDRMNQMNQARLLEFEQQVYASSKKHWGCHAFVGTHPTWYPFPGRNEFRKNGLMWWRHPRDYAQTDEVTPFCCRTGMVKAAAQPVWYNEYYQTRPSHYVYEHWTCLLAGGRVNIHPFYPKAEEPEEEGDFRILPILRGGADRIRSRTRLLDFIMEAPLQCPVAVVFGHWGVMNWTYAQYFDSLQAAITLCNELARRGYPADLIPSSEIQTVGVDGKRRWFIAEDDRMHYGRQPYEWVLFYGVTESDQADIDALWSLGDKGATRRAVLPPAMDQSAWAQKVAEDLRRHGIQPQTAWVESKDRWKGSMYRPPMSGLARFTDGTLLWASGSQEEPRGETIRLENASVLSNDGRQTFQISAEAIGVLACRFGKEDSLVALAASDLTFFRAGGMTIDIADRPTDVVLWKEDSGVWQGVFQAEKNELPLGLKAVAEKWYFLKK